MEDLRAPLQVKAVTCCVDAFSWCIDTVCREKIVHQELQQTTWDEGNMLSNQEQFDQDDQEFIDIRHGNNDEHIFTRTTTERDDRDCLYF